MRNIREISFGQVWRLHSDGQSPAEVWSAAPLVQHPLHPEPDIPGSNGLQVFTVPRPEPASAQHHAAAHGDQRRAAAQRMTWMLSLRGCEGNARREAPKHLFER
jgi:hypothetical protein